MSLNRRRFVSSVAAAIGYAGLRPGDVFAQGQGAGLAQGTGRGSRPPLDLDKVAKLNNNENPYGPPESVMQAMNSAWKWANRYGTPDGGLGEAIQTLHGVKGDNVIARRRLGRDPQRRRRRRSCRTARRCLASSRPTARCTRRRRA